ncbi:hypothetical protein ACFM0N_003102 [Vibrio parahaemolyticus]|nr:hypothetical protein [Vibrio parahaemolyticus]EGR1549869.1 hypothetical protein [Vibrio parahaemolyticus]EJG0591717.1 hypothetical protein [Vibrio parahaemolyticus]
MSKVKIKLISIGHLPLEFNIKSVGKFKSSQFEIHGEIERLALRCDSDGMSWEFSDDIVRKQLPELGDADFMIAIVNGPLEDNWYSRRLGGNKVAFTFHEIKGILQWANIPLENVIYRMLNAYTLAYKRAGNRIPDFEEMTDFTHDETRGCLFDMNGLKLDLVASCHKPIICSECQERLRRDRVPENVIKAVEKDIKKIRKDLYYRILDRVKRHPIFALFLSSLFALFLGITGSIAGSYAYEYIKHPAEPAEPAEMKQSSEKV